MYPNVGLVEWVKRGRKGGKIANNYEVYHMYIGIRQRKYAENC
jgi:hypothetical protein